MGTWGWMGLLPLWGLLLLILGAQAQEGSKKNSDSGIKKFSDKCNATSECFTGAFCDKAKGCQCPDETPITNHINKCGKRAKVNETCTFNEQCEVETPQTECRDGTCVCLFEQQAIVKPDGTHECIAVKNEIKSEKYIDPAMIGILVAMFLMFITICVVLRLFSRARWRENRTIFNTPNPRLMNVSLLRDSKLLHERRGSRGSMRGPSRQPSMASLRPHSPNSQGRLFLGSRRGSHGSSTASPTRSNKSPPGHGNSSVTTPMLESVTVEIQDGK